MDLGIIDALYEAEKCSPVWHAPDFSRRVLRPNTFEKMDTRKAEAVGCDHYFNESLTIHSLLSAFC